MERPEAEGGLPNSIQRPLDVEYTTRVLRLEHERLKTLGEAAHVVSFFFEEDISYDTALLIQKGMDASRTREALVRTCDLLANIQDWDHAIIEPLMRELVTNLGLKAGLLFGAVR
ncbi:MAG: glutamate--tRNA ligase, partial [Acidobacteria bacterium]